MHFFYHQKGHTKRKFFKDKKRQKVVKKYVLVSNIEILTWISLLILPTNILRIKSTILMEFIVYNLDNTEKT